MTAIMDVIASIALAAQLNSGSVTGPRFMSQSMPLSVVETKQGMYKEYTVDKVDDSALDEIRRGYKTAEETDEGKTKVNLILDITSLHQILYIFTTLFVTSIKPFYFQYWAIFAVLVAGSFIIPMAQYYWYVAEED